MCDRWQELEVGHRLFTLGLLVIVFEQQALTATYFIRIWKNWRLVIGCVTLGLLVIVFEQQAIIATYLDPCRKMRHGTVTKLR